MTIYVCSTSATTGMRISDAQRRMLEFERARGWDEFTESQIFTHLVEEISEIGRHILVREGYKVKGLGHEVPEDDVAREFGQAFSLLLQLVNRLGVDLEKAFREEIERMEERFDPEKWRSYLEEGLGRG